MAHSALHFSLGMILGTGLFLPRVFRVWKKSTNMARPYARWLVGSAVLGVYAIVPSLLRRIGLSDHFCEGWWMNLFLLHAALQKMKAGGEIFAQALIFFLFAVQYVALLAAIRRIRRTRDPSSRLETIQ